MSKPDVYSGDQGLEEVLNRQDVHAVVVVLPIGKQPEVILKALKAGKHVLSEVRAIYLSMLFGFLRVILLKLSHKFDRNIAFVVVHI